MNTISVGDPRGVFVVCDDDENKEGKYSSFSISIGFYNKFL